ncbi:Probable cytochrome P450 4aa1 [Gryllus bimaculatus]|nr:Probable cytochrome P450 4aa1 [Gryllus bimaculatus]
MHLGRTAYELFGGVFRAWVTIFPMFVVLEPEAIQKILSSQKHTEKISLYRLLHNFLGQGLITSSGEEWHTHRKLIQPSFHINILEGFVTTFYDCANIFVNRLQPTGPKGVNITSYINNCVLNILNESVLGIPVDEKETKAVSETPFRKGKVVVPHRLVRPWLLLNWVYKLTEDARKEMQHKNDIIEFAKKALEERRKLRKEAKVSSTANPEKKCLLDFLIGINENNEDFTDEDIVNEVCTFMLAGQDSVGAALAFAVIMLAKHQEEQERVVEELESIFNGSDRIPTRQDLAAMRYLEQCLKETLRLYPSVPIMARRLGHDVTIGKHTLPKGAEILISPFAVHRLKHIYANPETFDPSRFCYKFSMMEMKTVLSVLLRKYKLEPVPGKDVVDLKYRLTLRSKGGVWVKLSPREPL